MSVKIWFQIYGDYKCKKCSQTILWFPFKDHLNRTLINYRNMKTIKKMFQLTISPIASQKSSFFAPSLGLIKSAVSSISTPSSYCQCSQYFRNESVLALNYSISGSRWKQQKKWLRSFQAEIQSPDGSTERPPPTTVGLAQNRWTGSHRHPRWLSSPVDGRCNKQRPHLPHPQPPPSRCRRKT